MTTRDRSPLGDAAEADVVEQRRSVNAVDDDVWSDAQRVLRDRASEVSEADLLEQAIGVPEDGSEEDR